MMKMTRNQVITNMSLEEKSFFPKAISDVEYKSKYSKEALKAPKKKRESSEDFETRSNTKNSRKSMRRINSWKSTNPLVEYIRVIETLLRIEKTEHYSTVVFQDFERK